jgi:ribosomal protein L36
MTKKIKIPAPRKHGLYDYSSKLSIQKRRRALIKAVKQCLIDEKLTERQARNKIVKRLNVIYIYNKHRYPKTAAIFKNDMYYIQKKFPLL